MRRWVELATDDPIAELSAVIEPIERLDRLYDRVLEVSEVAAVDSALLADADHPLLAPVLEHVTGRRLKFLAAAYRELGLAPAAARAEVLVAYTAYLGVGQLLRHSPELIERDRAGFRRAMRRNIENQR